jgi:hypothetical protein
MKLFSPSDNKIKREFIDNCALIIHQGRQPSTSWMALENSAFRNTERSLKIKLSIPQKWDLFKALVNDMKLSLETELKELNDKIVTNIAGQIILNLEETMDMNEYRQLFFPKNSIDEFILNNPSLHRGNKIKKLISKLEEFENFESYDQVRKWALDVGKLGLK